MRKEQQLYRKYAPARFCVLCLCCGLAAFWRARTLGLDPRLLLPLVLAVPAASLPYYAISWTYRCEGDQLLVFQGRGGHERPCLAISSGDILSCGVYLPGQLSARQASRVTRAHLFLDPRSKRYLLYRLSGGGTGILIFSPDRAMQESFIQECWIFRASA